MRKFLENKALGAYFIMISAVLSLIIAIAYALYTVQYGIFNRLVLCSLILVVLVNLIMTFFNTKVDSYIQIVGVIFSALTFSLFLQDCVGTINDYLNDVVFMGSGASIGMIFILAGGMLVIGVINVTGCFMKKEKVQITGGKESEE